MQPSHEVIVTEDNFNEVVRRLSDAKQIAVDTETTGLYPYLGDSLFSIIVAVGEDAAYFNFNTHDTPSLPRSKIAALQPLFNGGRLVFMHNAKFDWHFLEKEGLTLNCDVWCTLAGARVCYNDHMQYSLSACAERIGLKKDDAVEEYIKKHKEWEWVQIPGKKQRSKDKYYDKVPLDIMSSYGMQDARVTYALGMHQHQTILDLDNSRPQNKGALSKVMECEVGVTRVCQKMERGGVRIDTEYCREVAEAEQREMHRLEAEFLSETGFAFRDGPKCLQQVFSNLNIEYPLTLKGNPRFDDDFLASLSHPIPKLIQRWRGLEKRVGTYFLSYLHFADSEGMLHANMKQAGTATGRFSYSEPNLQNMPKSEETILNVRRAIIPEDDHCLVAIDYKQMEFRLMLDYAKEDGLIEKIKQGHDPHQATADFVGIQRKPAKTLNFALLYGMGIKRLAGTLGCSEDEARSFRSRYFSGLPKVRRFLRDCTSLAEKRGHVYDWAGGRLNFSDPKFSYKAANGIIQGGCARVVKLAMIELDEYLDDKKSRMLIQIHDEILFQVHKDELDIIPHLQSIMEKTYPHKAMPLTCSVEHSWKSFGEMEEGIPSGL